jgi:hypothetical protein
VKTAGQPENRLEEIGNVDHRDHRCAGTAVGSARIKAARHGRKEASFQLVRPLRMRPVYTVPASALRGGEDPPGPTPRARATTGHRPLARFLLPPTCRYSRTTSGTEDRMPRARTIVYGLLAMALILAAPRPAAFGAEPVNYQGEKREAVFAFAAEPSVTKEGDSFTITFEAKGFCDCTVAIEDARGRIVRHLASGVLGSRAPEPFRRNSRKQSLRWDGKDDQGRYVTKGPKGYALTGVFL